VARPGWLLGFSICRSGGGSHRVIIYHLFADDLIDPTVVIQNLPVA